MKKPTIIINFKTYKQGKDAVELAKKISKVDKKIILGVQASDVYEIVKAVKNPVYTQHIDLKNIKKDKAKGSFLNHSDHRLRFDVLKKSVKKCKQVGLKAAVFAANLKEAVKIEKLRPDYLIVEPPELIGGKKSVSKARPELIKEISKKLKIKFLVGAGIKTNEDVKIAMKLGANGVAVSSGVVKARNPVKALKKLMA